MAFGSGKMVMLVVLAVLLGFGSAAIVEDVDDGENSVSVVELEEYYDDGNEVRCQCISFGKCTFFLFT